MCKNERVSLVDQALQRAFRGGKTFSLIMTATTSRQLQLGLACAAAAVFKLPVPGSVEAPQDIRGHFSLQE